MDWYKNLILGSIKDRLPGTTVPSAPWLGNRALEFHSTEWESVFQSDLDTLASKLPSERSRFRKNGLAQWDTIAAMGAPATRVSPVLDPKNKNPVLPKREKRFNKWWYDYMQGMFSRGQCPGDGYHKELNWKGNGRTMVDTAHILTHARMADKVAKTGDLYLHGLHGYEFLQTLCEIFVASLFNLPMDPLPGKKTALPYGVYVHPDIRMGFDEDPPEARMPLPSKRMQVADDILVVIPVAVKIGPDPVVLTGGRENPLRDWWSYQPISLTIVGWETATWMAAQEVRPGVRISGSVPNRLEFVSPANDLLEPKLLFHYLSDARQHLAERNTLGVPERYFNQDIKKIVDEASKHTCFLPCNTCFVPNKYMEDGLKMPPGWKPKQWKDPDNEEWGEYRTNLRKAFRAVDKAKRGYYGSNYARDKSERATACKEVYKKSAQRIRRKLRR